MNSLLDLAAVNSLVEPADYCLHNACETHLTFPAFSIVYYARYTLTHRYTSFVLFCCSETSILCYAIVLTNE